MTGKENLFRSLFLREIDGPLDVIHAVREYFVRAAGEHVFHPSFLVFIDLAYARHRRGTTIIERHDRRILVDKFFDDTELGKCRARKPVHPDDCLLWFRRPEPQPIQKESFRGLYLDNVRGSHVPSCQPARYFSCFGVSLSICVSMDSSFTLATIFSISSGTS